MRYTAKQWSATIWAIDVFAAAVVLFLSWLVWSLYQQSGEFHFPGSIATPFYVVIFVVLRSIARKEKKKAEAAEALSRGSSCAPDEEKA